LIIDDINPSSFIGIVIENRPMPNTGEDRSVAVPPPE
jgi:hypothetical protein